MFGIGSDTTRYELRQNLISIGDDYWIKDANGNRAYKVDGKALSIDDKFVFEDTAGKELAVIHREFLHATKTMVVEGPDGSKKAEVHKNLINVIGTGWTVKINGQDDTDVHGDITSHEYTIGTGGDMIAKISKAWFSVSDSYGVEVKRGVDDIVVLAVAVIIDEMAHGDKDEDDKDKD